VSLDKLVKVLLLLGVIDTSGRETVVEVVIFFQSPQALLRVDFVHALHIANKLSKTVSAIARLSVVRRGRPLNGVVRAYFSAVSISCAT
jgi:hypothetical protein